MAGVRHGELPRRDAAEFVEAASRGDVAAERRVLDARAHEFLTRAGSMLSSAFACLDAMAGDTVEAACEKALFQTPEATAVAVSYTSAQLTRLADLTMHVRLAKAPLSLPLSAISAAPSSAIASDL